MTPRVGADKSSGLFVGTVGLAPLVLTLLR
jgi:hypothetical protein